MVVTTGGGCAPSIFIGGGGGVAFLVGGGGGIGGVSNWLTYATLL